MCAKPRIQLPKEIYKLYFNDSGNPIFENEMLQPAHQYIKPQKLIAIQATKGEDETKNFGKALSTTMKGAVIGKFGSKPTNAITWLDTFEMECTHLKVLENRF